MDQPAVRVFVCLGAKNLRIGQVDVCGDDVPEVRVMNQRASKALFAAASAVGVWQVPMIPDGDEPQLVTFTSDAETDWGGHLFLAQEYLDAKRNGVTDYVLRQFVNSMTPQARALAAVGELAGAPLETFTVRSIGSRKSKQKVTEGAEV